MLLTNHFLYSESKAPRLRVGVLLDDDFLAPPFADVLVHIQTCNFADLVLLVYNAEEKKAAIVPRRSLFRRTLSLVGDPKRRKSVLWSLYDKLDARFARDERRLLAPSDVSTLLAAVPRIGVVPLSKGFTHRFTSEDVATIRSYDLDVILRFGFNIIRGEILKVPRYGIWSYHHGDNDFYRGGPAHFWELVEGNPLSGVMLQILSEELDAGTVLCKGLAPTAPTLLWSKNRVQPYLLGSTFVIRKLFELHRGGMSELETKSVAPQVYLGRQKIYRTPANSKLARFLIAPVVKKAISKPFQQPRIDHWRIAFRTGQPLRLQTGITPDLSGFRWLDSPPGRFYADPFLWADKGRVFCFFEDYRYASERGRISCGELTKKCELVDVRPVLELQHHLSYPFVFDDNGDIFMVPESADNGTVDLYRAKAFPFEWEYVRTILDAPGLDTTIVQHDGLYWMFTSISEPRGASAQLALLFSPTLTGKYQFHLHTPITADARYARCAGRIFEQEGFLIRPSQDSSGTYGKALHFRKITELTPKTYAEEPFVTLNAPRGFTGLHTYDRAGFVEVIDGKQRMLVSGLADPQGVADRQTASRELRHANVSSLGEKRASE
jgi:hypothetical protein